jgi:ABC-type multidrug transport system fused ATPase/permease subunit
MVSGQIIISLLELLGLLASGALVSVIVRIASGQEIGDRVSEVLSLINLNQSDWDLVLLVLAGGSLLLFLFRSASSLWFSRRSLYFSGRLAAKLSLELAEYSLILGSKVKSLNLSQQEIAYATTGGSTRFAGAIIGSLLLISSDVLLLTIVGAGLFYIDVFTTFILMAYFILLAFLLHYFTAIRVKNFSRSSTHLNIDSSQYLLETLELSRELALKHLLSDRVKNFGEMRNQISRFQASLQFIPSLSKYVLEIGILFGVSFIALIQFAELDFVGGSAVLGLFVIAGARLAPSIFRIQQGFVSLLASIQSTKHVALLLEQKQQLSLPIKSVVQKNNITLNSEEIDNIDKTLIPVQRGLEVGIENLNFSFGTRDHSKESKEDILLNISMHFLPNSISAILGKSGVGKSTLLDLLTGFSLPKSGFIKIDRVDITEFIQNNPGAVALVPQEPKLIRGTIIENITLQPSNSEEDIRRVSTLIELVGLNNVDQGEIFNLETQLGFGQRQLSGGQKQRLALARALFTNPRLVFLDEFTSGLDSFNERLLVELVGRLQHRSTIIMVSHRPRTLAICSTFYVLKHGSASKFDTLADAEDFMSR